MGLEFYPRPHTQAGDPGKEWSLEWSLARARVLSRNAFSTSVQFSVLPERKPNEKLSSGFALICCFVLFKNDFSSMGRPPNNVWSLTWYFPLPYFPWRLERRSGTPRCTCMYIYVQGPSRERSENFLADCPIWFTTCSQGAQ